MTPINTSKGSFLFVEVPEDGFEFTVETYRENELYILFELSNGDFQTADLPPGSWQSLSTTRDVTEEVAGEIIEWYKDSDDEGEPPYTKHSEFLVCKDYENGDDLDTRLDSLQSLLKAHNLDPNKNYAILKKVNNG